MWITVAHNIYRSVWEMVTSRGFPGSSDGKASACNAGTWVWPLGREDPLEKEIAIYSSTLAWKILWMEEPGRLQSIGSQRVRHDWATSLTLTFSTQIFIVVWSLSHIRFFAASWSATCQAFLSCIISQSLLKLMSIESVMPPNHLILCHPFLPLPSVFPVSGSFPMSQLFATGGQSIGASASASVLQWIFRVDFL